MKCYIIGCGGVGSWLAPSIIRLIGAQSVMLVDGDKLEAKNLDRQLFSKADIGRNKAEVLAAKYGCEFLPEWYFMGLVPHESNDVILGVVDNNPARVAILNACDFENCRAIFGANETHSAEAYYYRPEWKESPLDPRVYYPELLTVTTGDPRGAAIGCTGAAQEANRQLVSANFTAAALVQHLFVANVLEAPKLEAEVREHLPHRLFSSLSKLGSHKPAAA